MLQWLKKHPANAIIVFVLIVLLPVFIITQHYWPHVSSKTSRLSSEQGFFDINHWQEKGATVTFVELPELPIVDIQLLFPAGSAFDKDKPGLAYLTAQMIGENTKKLDAQEIFEAFENVGAQFAASANRDYAVVSLRSLSDSKSLDASLAMLQQLLAETVFDEDAFKREQNRLLAAIKMREQSPAKVAAEHFYKGIYGDHPYAHPICGLQDSVEALNAADLENFYSSYYAQNLAVVSIAGDLSQRKARKIASDLLKGLPTGVSNTQIPEVQLPKANSQHVKFPSEQTHIFYGMPAMAKNNPDFYAFTVGNHILGGNPLVSQLFNVVREDHGLAYYVGSQLVTYKQLGPFYINLQTRGSEAKKAMKLVEKTLEKYMKNGPGEKEITDAKANINGRFALGLGSNSAINDLVAMLAFYKLPWDYHEQYKSKIDAVSKDDIRRVFNEYLKTADFVQVSVGEHAP
jgi:zinc protease